MIKDSFISAFRSIWVNKMRSILTLLGIVIGIYTVVTLLAVATGLQEQISGEVESLGPRSIVITQGESDDSTTTPNFSAQLAPSTLHVDDVLEIKNKAIETEPNVDYAIFLGGSLKLGDKKVTGIPVGSTVGIPEVFGLKIESGNNLSEANIGNKDKVIFLGRKHVETLGAKLGDELTLGVNKFTLTGIYKDPESSGLGLGDAQSMFIVPVSVAIDINKSDQLDRIMVKAKNTDNVEAAKKEVTKILKEKHGTQDFTVLLSSDILKTVTKITDVLKYAVVGIAAISLLVAGIGISNIMLVTVTERTREIGIRKAVGATESAILTQFLIEAVVLTLLGSLIGLGLASLSSIAAAKFSPLDPVITWQTVALAVGMGVVSGIIFGLFPAIRAARKNPVEALRFE